MSELESRLSRSSHKTPYRAVCGKGSNTYEKVTGDDVLNSTTTKKTTDVAPITKPIIIPFSPPLSPRHLHTNPSSLSPSPPPTALKSSQVELSESQSLLSRHHQLRPYRRLVRSNQFAPDTSSAKAAPNSQRIRRKAKNTNVPCHRKDKVKYGPPPSMITQGFYTTPSPTICWVSQQSRNLERSSSTSINHELERTQVGLKLDSDAQSTIKSPGMKKAVSQMELETDLRRSKPATARLTQDLEEADCNRISEIFEEINSDESDLYLTAAKEEGLEQHSSVNSSSAPNTSRKSRVKHSSLSVDARLNPRICFRHESDHERGSATSSQIRSETNEHASEYKRNIADRAIAMDQINKINTHKSYFSSVPSTPRDHSRELSPDTSSFGARSRILHPHVQQAYYTGRRSSIPETSLSIRPGNRQVKGISAPHTYNSSPLAPRSSETQDLSDISRQIDDTESTDSTTAQSTVWDELDDLKSRIQRLESSGKPCHNSTLEPTRSSNERPSTATTTVTTMSTSPKRDRANSKSSTDQSSRPPVSDTSYILRSALIKSKPFLDPEIYRALEATTSDAISLTVMVKYSGQSGSKTNPQASSTASTAFSERQACRRAESMCRSLTELCLAMSEGKLEKGNPSFSTGHREKSNLSVPESLSRTSSRSSNRVLSHLEARRSSLLAPGITTLKAQPDSGGSTVSSPVGRRTSLFFRGSRHKVESPDEDEEHKSRTPSRVFSEIGSLRESLHDKGHTFTFSEKSSVKNQSLLSHRRHRVSASFSLSSAPTTSSLSGWRNTERDTSERERERTLVTMRGKGAEDRAERQSSLARSLIVESPGVQNKRTRQLSTNDHTSAGQGMIYH